MIKEFRKYEELFRELDEHITGQAHIYVIGGAVMLYHELKKATKDIDIVVRTLAEFKAVEQALKKKQSSQHKLFRCSTRNLTSTKYM